MHLVRTEKARQELAPGVRTLSQKQRTLLLMADGRKSLSDLQGLFDGQGERIALDLLREGYLASGASAARPAPGARRPPAYEHPSRPNTAAPVRSPAPVAVQAPAAADNFEGKRSLATTRMFLFDLCERMFARRDPALAERFRNQLREAKDRASMLAASRAMLEAIEQAAGHERADSIAERIAMLLPPEELTA